MNPTRYIKQSPKSYLMISTFALLMLMLLSQIQLVDAQQTYPGYEIFTTGPSRSLIPANAVYTRETRIGSFRPGYQEWGCPVFRVPANEVNALVTITNTYSGRVENWPIPTYAVPANAEDGHMCIVNLNTNTVYEFFEAVWTGARSIRAGGMVAFPMNGQGISDPPHRRVTASGFANMYGMIKREDFVNPATGQLDPNNTVLDHALTINLPPAILGPDTYVSPAVGGEVAGTNSSNGIPMGALFALPRSLNVDTLNVHPVVRTILRAARDYGLYVADGTGTANYGGNYAGTIEMEPNLLATLYGGNSNDPYMETIQSQVYAVISQYGIYRVTAGTGPAPTFTSTPAVTATIAPTSTPTVRPSNTPVPPTSTPRPTNTATVTPRPTDFGGGQDGTPTNTPVPPTSTPRPSNTPVPPTSTPRPTNTPTSSTPTPTSLTFYPLSPLRNPIAGNAVYTRETRIGTFRPGYEVWACPVYRVPATESWPLVTVTNTYSGRIERWPIPTYAVPAAEDDAQICVVDYRTMTAYEFIDARWTSSTTISAGGMMSFPLSGDGISNPPYRRVNAAGFANTNGMIKLEDFINPATGQIDGSNPVINHALNMNIPPSILTPNTYVAPAVGGEEAGTNPDGLPVGARLALPRDLNVDALNVSPITRAILRAVRDYGVYIFGGNGSSPYRGNNVGTLEVETGVLADVYGGASNDIYMNIIADEVYNVIAQYGLYRVTDGTGPTPTNTSVPPTSTPRPTNTPVPPTATPRPSSTPLPTATFTVTPRPTDVGGGQELTPTATLPPTNTPVPPTATPRPTNTPVPPTATPVPSSTPNPTGLGSRIVIPSTIRAGTSFNANVTLDNPALAAGGGVSAMQLECTVTSPRLTGQSVTAGSVFGPNPVVVMQVNDASTWMLYAISQSGSNPPVTVGGTVITIRIRANSRGTASITCTSEIIAANGTTITLNPTTVTFTVSR